MKPVLVIKRPPLKDHFYNRDHFFWPTRGCLIQVSLYFFPPELTEFVLQLDEEVEGMQATVLHFDPKDTIAAATTTATTTTTTKNSGGSSPTPKDHTPSSSSSSSKGSKDRTKGIANGPVDSGSTTSSTNSSSKT